MIDRHKNTAAVGGCLEDHAHSRIVKEELLSASGKKGLLEAVSIFKAASVEAVGRLAAICMHESKVSIESPHLLLAKELQRM